MKVRWLVVNLVLDEWLMPDEILKEIEANFRDKKLKGRHFLVTSGPTIEPIDPVRFIGNRSSGLQGGAIANELVESGAEVTFITGPR